MLEIFGRVFAVFSISLNNGSKRKIIFLKMISPIFLHIKLGFLI